MTISRIVFLLLLLIIIHKGYSQDIKAPGWKFRSVNQGGLLQGQDISAFLLQTVNGFEKNNFFAGIGTGLDFYKYKSIPLFADVRKYFGHQHNQFFIYADAGTHFIWEKKDKLNSVRADWKPGFYGDAGIGYRWTLSGNTGFVLNAGYSYKRVNQKESYTICPFAGPCYTQVEKYMFDLNRLAVKIGLMF